MRHTCLILLSDSCNISSSCFNGHDFKTIKRGRAGFHGGDRRGGCDGDDHDHD